VPSTDDGGAQGSHQQVRAATGGTPFGPAGCTQSVVTCWAPKTWAGSLRHRCGVVQCDGVCGTVALVVIVCGTRRTISADQGPNLRLAVLHVHAAMRRMTS
jgi:hypothetical protein